MARIIIVDDSKLMRIMLQRTLEQAGHEVDAWTDLAASEIPEKVASSNADLLITDYQMPGCNGLTVARMVRKTRPDLPIVVLTASRDPSILDALKRLDVSHILHKPIREEGLLDMLKQVL